ncbi:hypothetical protein FVEG_00321 [Fusarium verticillioides 7600]|uniref:hypothetical protein n=1 Tax=Gibberella moniliformis (strain M3125 / FGSC 7600) TaxID=334819 RepID=UPI0003ECD936|nr:hypothetical protein FVEG_00321 [Fusarium verticillioides 7600]EWG36201.1 hypothetical protein FVEG_00321 [Fusarium verticillioides 7600]
MDTLTHVLVLPEALERLDSPSIIIPRTANTSEEVVPYAHLTDLTQSLQHDLATLGISVGSKVAIVLPNGLAFVTVLLATIRQRAISAPIHPNSTREECKQIFSLMTPDLVAVMPSEASPAAAAVLAAQDLGLPVASCHRYPQSGRLSFCLALKLLGVPLLEVYGMTETAPAIFCNPFPVTETSTAIKRHPGQYPIPDAVDVMILPPERAPGLEPNGDLDGIENTEPVARLTKELGVKGEICLRGKNIMAGYTNNPAANREAFLPNGFFRTGDLGVIKPRQYLALIGRVKEIINKGGEKISPAEIEHVARLHDQVNDAACFRISDEIYGEVIGT